MGKKTYIVSAETSSRILKNWIVTAVSKKQALIVFKEAANISEKSKLRHLKINLKNQI